MTLSARAAALSPSRRSSLSRPCHRVRRLSPFRWSSVSRPWFCVRRLSPSRRSSVSRPWFCVLGSWWRDLDRLDRRGGVDQRCVARVQVGGVGLPPVGRACRDPGFACSGRGGGISTGSIGGVVSIGGVLLEFRSAGSVSLPLVERVETLVLRARVVVAGSRQARSAGLCRLAGWCQPAGWCPTSGVVSINGCAGRSAIGAESEQPITAPVPRRFGELPYRMYCMQYSI
ncbi:hypothetical protein HNR05_002231 [Leifsonia psychrotolerans]|uniref:Uncharacterized protein n=1 Tax=Glaciibacter psychrotolerans TaxID=670054 RepID=A0A7Z0EFU0_9MICO|nr:hypothetical protein [Leifsonia psychrotolerans]